MRWASLIALGSLFVSPLTMASEAEELRVYLNNQCLVADEPVVVENYDASKSLFLSGIVSTVAQAMINNVVRGVAGRIRNAGSSKEYVYSSGQDIYLYRADFSQSPDVGLNPALSCITMVAGDFAGQNEECIADYEPAMMSAAEVSITSIAELRRQRRAGNVLKRANICLDGEPHYVFESRVVLSDDGANFRLVNAALEVNELQSARRADDSRAMLSSISLFEPSADGRGRLLATNWMRYGELSAGARANGESPSIAAGWSRLPQLSGTARQAYEQDAAPYLDVSRAIERLETDTLRAIREQSALRQQASQEDDDVAATLRAAADKLDTTVAMNTARLKAYRAEAGELPRVSRDYMLVRLEASIIESRSPQALKVWLGKTMEANSQLISRGVVTIVNDRD